MSGIPVVYRAYDATGRLLYVGSSMNLSKRMENHRAMSWWFRVAQQVVVERHEDIAAALAAESLAIGDERPVANVKSRGAGALTDLSRLTEDDLRAVDEWVGDDHGARSMYLPRSVRGVWYARRLTAATP